MRITTIATTHLSEEQGGTLVNLPGSFFILLVLRYMGCDQEYEFKLAVAQGDSDDDDEEEDKEGDMSD